MKVNYLLLGLIQINKEVSIVDMDGVVAAGWLSEPT